MSLRIENISDGKIIGIGAETILPGETKTVPEAYEDNPVLALYAEKGFVRATRTRGTQTVRKDASPGQDDDTDQAEAAEALRKARLASLKGISEEALGRLAQELGVNPAECKDSADVLKKVKAALKA